MQGEGRCIPHSVRDGKAPKEPTSSSGERAPWPGELRWVKLMPGSSVLALPTCYMAVSPILTALGVQKMPEGSVS